MLSFTALPLKPNDDGSSRNAHQPEYPVTPVANTHGYPAVSTTYPFVIVSMPPLFGPMFIFAPKFNIVTASGPGPRFCHFTPPLSVTYKYCPVSHVGGLE